MEVVNGLDMIIEFLDTIKFPKKIHPEEGFILLSEENLNKVFTRTCDCRFIIVENCVQIAPSRFDEELPLIEFFQSMIMNLMLQKSAFTGDNSIIIENTIQDLETIIDGERPSWRLYFYDNTQHSYFHGEIFPYDYTQATEISYQNIDLAADIIKNAKNIVLLNGAGLSVSAGIKDFRSKDGFYNSFNANDFPCTEEQKKLVHNNPEMVFHKNFFNLNPMVNYLVDEKFYTCDVKPTLSHWFQAELVKKNKILKVYTQNIDGLLRECGVPRTHLLEVHGTHTGAKCHTCCQEFDYQLYQSLAKENKYPILCKDCGGYVRRACVLFGESLPEEYYTEVDEHCAQADLLIVTGTSLKVGPVNQMVQKVSENCPRLIIDRRKVGLELGIGSNPDHLGKDLFFCGNADDAYRTLAEKLGWLSDIENQKKEYDIRFDSLQNSSEN